MRVLDALGLEVEVTRTVRKELAWLLGEDAAVLGADQREIQGLLRDFVAKKRLS